VVSLASVEKLMTVDGAKPYPSVDDRVNWRR